MKKMKTKRRISFRTKLLITYFIIILLVPLIGGIFFYSAQKSSVSEVKEYADTIAELIGASLSLKCQTIEQETFDDDALYRAIRAYNDSASGNNVQLRSAMYTKLFTEEDIDSLYYVSGGYDVISAKRNANVSLVIPEIEILKNDYVSLLRANNHQIWESYDENYVILKKMLNKNSWTYTAEGYLSVMIPRSYFKQEFGTAGIYYVMLDSRQNPLLYSDDISNNIILNCLESKENSGTTLYNKTLYSFHILKSPKWTGDMMIIINLQSARETWSSFLMRMVCIVIFATAISLVLAFLFSKRMSKGIKTILFGIENISRGEFNTVIELPQNDDLQTLTVGINDMTSHIKRLMDEVLIQQKLKQEAEYQTLEYRYYALQCQIHPHLLFNTLESINGVAKLNNDFESSRLICQLATLLRQTIQKTEVFCPLKDEISYVENYLSFYKLIYKERLNVRIFVDKDVEDYSIPSFITIPIVENTIVHVIEKTKEPCTLSVACYREDNKVFIEIEDDGPGMKNNAEDLKLRSEVQDSSSHKSIGLKSVTERIYLLYKETGKVLIKAAKPRGTMVQIVLPANHYADEVNLIENSNCD